MTVRHLLPLLQQKLKWPEQKRTIILVGTRGEVPIAYREPKEPMLTPVSPGTMVVGYELHQSLGLSVGDRVKMLAKEFAVAKCHPERGNKDDITIWINLNEAQELLDKRGKINGILALQCYCTGARVGKILEDISRILPDTQVVEFATKVIIRAEARRRAALAATEAIEAETANRARLRREREAFANILVPLVIVGCIIWIGFLAFGNVRERRSEIGILTAIGLRAAQVFVIFLAKAMLMGLIGGLVGYFAGFLVGAFWGEAPLETRSPIGLFDWGLFLLVLFLAPLLAGLASWIPAMLAAQQDPAVVLREG